MQILSFQWGATAYALPLERVSDVAPAGRIHPVPLAPPAVRGLTERRGRPIAVVDLPRLLDDPAPETEAGHLVRLAPPLDGAALWVPSKVFSRGGTPAEDGHVSIDGRLHLLLDADALLKRAASAA